VAQCGISGVVLGPPNYHDYQNKLRKLHNERFSRMPFDAYKSRIKIVKDEPVVKKWLEDQSFRTEYTALNIPETLKLGSKEEVEAHFRQTHLANVVKALDTYTVNGAAAQKLQNRQLQALIRRAYDDQMRFPIKVVTVLSQQFARHGLQFFKVNKSVTHVAVARPRYLDLEATPVSEGVQKIVAFINATPKCTRRKLVEALAPGAEPAQAAQALAEEPAAAAPAEVAENVETAGSAAAPEAQPAPAAPVAETQSAELSSINRDLHWLIHQGHVIEFANGILETAKKPLPKPEPKVKEKKTAPAAEGAAAQTEGADSAGSEEEVAAADVSSEVVSTAGGSDGATEGDGGAAPVAGEINPPAEVQGEEEKKPE
jgi:hypothetical protein